MEDILNPNNQKGWKLGPKTSYNGRSPHVIAKKELVKAGFVADGKID